MNLFVCLLSIFHSSSPILFISNLDNNGIPSCFILLFRIENMLKVCMYVYIYIHTYIYIHILTYMYVSVCAHIIV